MEANIKHFSISGSKDVNTVIYQINETEPQYLSESPKYTIEKLDYDEQLIGENKRKTFYIQAPEDGESKDLLILSIGEDKVVVNMGILEENKVKISQRTVSIKFRTLYSQTETEYKQFRYTPNLKRSISIIDPETTEEVKPTLYFDEETNEIKGRVRLKPFKNYFAIEIKDDD